MIHDWFLKLCLDLQTILKSMVTLNQKQLDSIIQNFKIENDLSMLHFVLSLD